MKAKSYYTLLGLGNSTTGIQKFPAWEILFGDYDRDVVVDERDDCSEYDTIKTKIICTTDRQKDIEFAVDNLNNCLDAQRLKKATKAVEDEVEVSCFGFSHDAVQRAITDYRHDIPKLLATAIAVVDQAQVQSQFGAGDKVRESLNVAKYFIASASRSVSGLQSDLKSCEQEFKASLLDEI